MVSSDDIDELVSSVRDFVSHKEPPRTRSRILMDRLILRPDQRIHEDEVPQIPINTAFLGVAPKAAAPTLPPVKRFDKSGLEATIAELEAAVTTQFDDWEEDEGESFEQDAWAESAFPTAATDSNSMDQAPASGPEMGGLDDADAPQSGNRETEKLALNDAIADLSGIDEDALATSVTAGFDEAALRSLVVAIVHEELGGELGERITRNVRKMVRREINRVLNSRELGEG